MTAATQQFNRDLQAIAVRAQLPPGAIAALQYDLAVDEFAATSRPSAGAIGQLQADYAAGLAAGTINIPALESDAQAVLASAGVPQTLIDQTGADLNLVVNSPNLTLADGQTIATDLQNILIASGGGR